MRAALKSSPLPAQGAVRRNVPCLPSRAPAAALVAAVLLAALLAVAPGARSATGPGGLAGATSAEAFAPFTLLASESGEVRFEFAGDPSGVRMENGTLVVEDRIHGETPAGPGASLPLASTWIALPPGARARIEATLLETEPLSWPAGVDAGARAAILKTLSATGWTTAPPCWTRNQWGIPFSFRPVVPDGAGGLSYVRLARFTVRSTEPAPGAPRRRMADGHDPFEAFYRGAFLNYDAGRAWRRAAAGQRSGFALEDTTFFWSTSRPWIRLRIPRQDIYEITGSDLAASGLQLSSLDPGTVRLFRPAPLPLDERKAWDESPLWMREVPIEVEAGDDGIFDPGDRIVFLGEGPDGWYHDLGADTTRTERWFRDPYNNQDVWWLTWDFPGNAPLRIPVAARPPLSDTFVTSARDRIHLEKDLIWDPRGKEVLDSSHPYPAAWQRYWWTSFAVNGDQEERIPVRIPDPVTDDPVRVRARFWGNSTDGGTWPDHAINFKLNGSVVASTDHLPNGDPWDFFSRRDVDATGPWLVPGDLQEFSAFVPTHPLSNPTATRYDVVYLGWIEAEYTRRLTVHADSLFFWAAGLDGGFDFELNGFSSLPDTLPERVWLLDATRADSVVRVLPRISDGTRARFHADLRLDRPGRFFARASDRLARLPAGAIEVVAPKAPTQYLRRPRAAVDGLILTWAGFRQQAAQLAAFRRDHLPGSTPGTVEVVDVQQIYDEFSFGRMDPTAIRNFLAYASENWTGGVPGAGPAYVVLLGDAHFDFRNLLNRGAKVYVPTYEGYWDAGLVWTIFSPQFGSDDFYGFLGGPDDTGLDLFIGRLPAESAFQAGAMIEKIIGYEKEPVLGPWRGRFTLVADDTCQGTNIDKLRVEHMRQTEQVADSLPHGFQQDKIYLLDYGAGCIYDKKPAAAEALRNRMNDGTLVVNYTGHGSEEQLADERVFEISSVAGLDNAATPFLFITASCSVGKYDFYGEGLGEALIRHNRGGAVAVFSAASIAYSTGNAELNQKFLQAVFPRGNLADPQPLGMAAALAKSRLHDPGNLNSRRYALLGDPATEIASPRLHVGLSLASARDHAPLGNTLLRGVLTELSGEVVDDGGVPQDGFQGTAAVRIYDSETVHRFPAVADSGASYNLLGAPIYRGAAAVENGRFTLRFQTPSALRTGQRGAAKIYVYIEPASGASIAGPGDAAGTLDALSVPETEAPLSTDAQGPAIAVQFDQDPASLPPGAGFTATLYDSSGVNITGLVGSRSVIMQIEEGGNLVYVEDIARLVTFGDDYQRATLGYHVPSTLPANRSYELVLRASDNLKNSSAVRIPFSLSGSTGTAFALGDVYNFPNPTTGESRFFGQLTQDASVQVLLFTLSGRKIRTLEQRTTPVRFAREGIYWDGKDADGDRLANGVYLYKIRALPAGGGRTETAIGRLVVMR